MVSTFIINKRMNELINTDNWINEHGQQINKHKWSSKTYSMMMKTDELTTLSVDWRPWDSTHPRIDEMSSFTLENNSEIQRWNCLSIPD